MGISWSRVEKGPRPYRRKARQSVPGSSDHRESHAPKATAVSRRPYFTGWTRHPCRIRGGQPDGVTWRFQVQGLRSSPEGGVLTPPGHTPPHPLGLGLCRNSLSFSFPTGMRAALACPAGYPLSSTPTLPTHSEIQPPTAHKSQNYNQKINVDELQQHAGLL